jgi:hypothetical protein
MPNNYVLLERITLPYGATEVVFDNIPQTGYTDLVIKGSTRTDRGDSFNDYIKLLPNNSTSSWVARFGQGNGSGVGSYTESVAASIIAETNGGLSTANGFGNFEIYVSNYASSSIPKSFSSDSATSTFNTSTVINRLHARWNNNTAINSLTIKPGVGSNWIAGSSFSLYGVAELGTTPVVAPRATGGNIVASDGTYWYHAFTSSGAFVPKEDLSCHYLVVAGGGSGTGGYGTGGGAGGYRTSLDTSAYSTTANTFYGVTVGAGGSLQPAIWIGKNGSDSSVFGIVSTGGGGGGSYGTNNAQSGGSGGGGGGESMAGGAGNTPSTTPSQGNNGGAGGSATRSGGGGGAGGAGGSPVGNTCGAGGVGRNTNSAWASATGTGANSGYYAGGGGGGGDGQLSLTAGTGGLGGGASGSSGATPSAATANTGGGGGGGGRTGGGTGSGSAGGSGIVIIRYPMA